MISRFIKDLLKGDPYIIWGKLTVNPRGGFFGGKGCKYSRGAFVYLSLSTKCNLSCSYCPLMDNRTEPMVFDEYGIDEWKKLIERFPEWVSEAAISGGEPSLVRWMPDFANWLLDSGRKVCIFTNLAVPSRFKYIKKSSRLKIQATFHHCDNAETFTKNYYKVLEYGHKVEVCEIDNGEPKVLPFSKHKLYTATETADNEIYPDGMDYVRQFHCAPDAPKTKIVHMGVEITYQRGNNGPA